MGIWKKSNKLEPVVDLPKENKDEKINKSTGPLSLMFESLEIRQGWKDAANSAANKILKGKSQYQIVAQEAGIPWFVVGLIHLLEGNCNFATHLHNGDSLNARTVNVPKGRPKSGKPPFTWNESALDALQYDSMKPPMTDLETILYRLEKFNGLGYRKKGINSPYLWSGSQHYTSGKYVSDGVWSSTAVSKQVGAAVVLKVLANRGEVLV